MKITRRKAREYAFQLIYELAVQEDKNIDDAIRDTSESQGFESDEYIESTVKGVFDNLENIDKLISDSAVGWKLERISSTSLAILRLGVYEMLFGKSEKLFYKIAINEAVELSKKFDHERAPKFINGILNAVADKSGLKNDVTPNAEKAANSTSENENKDLK